jgi:2-succinyl-6-hydroxy-2,4-cyclohexadiene-1-carboxylate synthase
MIPNATITVRGYRAAVRVRMAADPAVPTVLALHGFTGSGEDFAEVHSAAGAGSVNWICPDFMGHGASDSPPVLDPYCLPACLQLIDKARQLAPDPQRVILLGYSMGGRIALHYLLRAAPLPALLIGCSPGLADAAERAARRAADQAWIRLLADPAGMEVFAGAWERQALIEPQTRLPEPLRSALAGRRRANNPAGLANSLLATGTGALPGLWDQLDRLPPLLLAHGGHDLKFASIARAMAARNSAFSVKEIASAGHAPHLEQPAGVAAILRGLLARP